MLESWSEVSDKYDFLYEKLLQIIVFLLDAIIASIYVPNMFSSSKQIACPVELLVAKVLSNSPMSVCCAIYFIRHIIL